MNTIERSDLRRDLRGDGAAKLLRRLVRDGLPLEALAARRRARGRARTGVAERRGQEKRS